MKNHHDSAIRKAGPYFQAEQGGSTALVFALLLMVLAMAAAAGVDYGLAFDHRSKAQTAADSAALAAAKAAGDWVSAHGSTAPELKKAKDAAATAARAFIDRNYDTAGLHAAPEVTVESEVTAGSTTSIVRLTGATDAYFLPVAGVQTIDFAVSSTATVSAAASDYHQFVFLVDVSNSMTVGGTDGDIGKLIGNQDIRCAFACHDTTKQTANFEACGGKKQPSCNKRETARATTNKTKLKIDYVNTAIGRFLTGLKGIDDMSQSGRISVSVYTFGTASGAFVPPTTNLADAITKASGLDAEVAMAYDKLGYTYIGNALTYLKGQIGNAGDGSSATRRKTTVVFVTDGVQNLPGSQYWGHTTNLDYGAQCEALKTLDVTVWSIYATYFHIPASDPFFDQYVNMVDSIRDDIPARLKGCASSPDKYFEATDGKAIEAALQSILQAAKPPSTVRLVN